eukprot:CAMPEP_0168642140 /NCGR_PEP_ID=MMETSP0503-20121227/6972_1 /TAXON_ID=89963 /ORGANISM="Heterocapsa rotundata, Strain SCCAP K-0483" /LENGTH=877 /DNA_ID=CAMNT_0008685439 /DNA_START=157 /DNA_END=2790 /DNA_ORIENTATION=-
MKPAPPDESSASEEEAMPATLPQGALRRDVAADSSPDFSPLDRSRSGRGDFGSGDLMRKTASIGSASGANSQVPFSRTTSVMGMRPGAGLVFQEPPKDVDPEVFDIMIRDEMARLSELLRAEIANIRESPAFGPAIGQLRILSSCNMDQVIESITPERMPTKAARNTLVSYVRGSFLEQDLIIALAGQEANKAGLEGSNKHGWATFLGLSKVGAKSGKVYAELAKLNALWRVITLFFLFYTLVNISNEVHEPEIRCAVLIFTVLMCQISGLVPNYCVGLLVPVLATALRVLPGKTIQETAKGCFGSMMNTMTAMVIGSFTINVIFMHCQMEVRFINSISSTFGSMPKLFLLVLMMGCMFVSAVTFVTLLALAAMMPIAMAEEGEAGKSLLLGVAIGCTLGGALTPISGTTSLVAMSALSEYGLEVDFSDWLLVSVPVCTLCCIAAWGILLALYGCPEDMSPDEDNVTSVMPLTFTHHMFIFLSFCFVAGAALEDSITPYIGSAGNLGLMLCAVAYSSGFLNKADFLAMPWEVLMILFGVNVLSFSLKESGLALALASKIAPANTYDVELWTDMLKITGFCATAASFMGHNVVATLAIPIVVAIGAKLYAPFLTTILAVIAIHVGVASPFSSTDMLLTLESCNAEGQRPMLKKSDFVLAGGLVAVASWLCIGTAGYETAIFFLGRPPSPIIIKAPSELIPTIVSHKSNFTDKGGIPLSRVDPVKTDMPMAAANATGEKRIASAGGKVQETREQVRTRKKRDAEEKRNADRLQGGPGNRRPKDDDEDDDDDDEKSPARSDDDDDDKDDDGEDRSRPVVRPRETPAGPVARAMLHGGSERQQTRLRRAAARRREREAEAQEERDTARRLPEEEEEVDMTR